MASWMIEENDPVRLEIIERAKRLGITDNSNQVSHSLGKVTLMDGREVNAHVVHAVDPIITDKNRTSVVTIERKYDPGMGKRSLPGGFLDPTKGGGVESGIQAATREAIEEAVENGEEIFKKAKITLIGTRNMDRPFDVRVAAGNGLEKKYGIKDGDIFLVSTQAVCFEIPDLAGLKLHAGDDAAPHSAQITKVSDLTRESLGIPDHFDMIMAALRNHSSTNSDRNALPLETPTITTAQTEPSDFLSIMAVGDVYGMKYEFVDHDIPVNSADLFYGPHPTYIEYQAKRYTDDTQMSLANAELLLEKSSEEIKRRDFIQAWMSAFRRDPRLGYSTFMFQLMNENLSPEEFSMRVDSSKGTTSGALMRAAPFGLLDDIDVVKKLAGEQAAPTHNTSVGITSAMFVAVSTHYLHHGGRMQHLESFLDLHLGKNWCSEENGRANDPHNGLMIASQILSTLKTGGSLSRILLAGVSQTRNADTDTICAAAMAISSRRKDIANDLPSNLREGYENSSYGLSYLRDIDTSLAKKFPRSNQYAKYQP